MFSEVVGCPAYSPTCWLLLANFSQFADIAFAHSSPVKHNNWMVLIMDNAFKRSHPNSVRNLS